MKSKIGILLLFCAFSQLLNAHGNDEAQLALRHWSFTKQNKSLDASFLMFKKGDVYLETADHTVVHYPLAAFAETDQAFVQAKIAQIEQVNKQRNAIKTAPAPKQKEGSTDWMVSTFLILMLLILYAVLLKQGHQYAFVAAALVLSAGLYGFKGSIKEAVFGTDPAFIDSAFAPFKPKVHTFWDATYFYVESKGIPDHQMMTGITGWQQQVPIPQCYIGSNAWPIPLNPVIADVPVPVNPQHFLRGAVAVAANGVAIFNPYTNTGVDALLDGQLDIYGGHCGRADDYHYHTAPLQLDSISSDILPIAFALDGFAVYASHEPDGSPMQPLDANHGHYGTNGVYHYHGTTAAPYMIGNMVGKVTEDNTLQIIPQAKANPVRPSLTPLNGAVITDCQPNATNNGYILTYTKGGQTYKVDYSWTPNGQYTFNFIAPTGTTTSTYNGFSQCTVPTTGTDDIQSLAQTAVIFPNPTTNGFSLKLSDELNPNDIQALSIFNLKGQSVYQTTAFKQPMALDNFKKGVYLVKIQISGRDIMQKLIVQ